jgi:hypothetical protein
MIVFLPSYAFLNAIVAVWTKSGFIQKLSAKKKVKFWCKGNPRIAHGVSQIFMEPQGSDVESVLRDYAAEIRKLVRPFPAWMRLRPAEDFLCHSRQHQVFDLLVPSSSRSLAPSFLRVSTSRMNLHEVCLSLDFHSRMHARLSSRSE